MKELIFTYSHMARHVTIDDDAKADAAYAATKAALDEYREYGNDKAQTIELDYGNTTETIRVGTIAAVSLCNLDADEDTVIKMAIRRKRMEAKIANALQPAAE